MPLPAREGDTGGDGAGRRILREVGWTLLGIVTFLEVFTMGDAGLGKFQHLEGWQS